MSLLLLLSILAQSLIETPERGTVVVADAGLGQANIFDAVLGQVIVMEDV